MQFKREKQEDDPKKYLLNEGIKFTATSSLIGAGLAGMRFSGINPNDVPEKQMLHIAAGAAIGLGIAGVASSIIILKELKSLKRRD